MIRHSLREAPKPGETFQVPGVPDKDTTLDKAAEIGAGWAQVIAFLIVAAVVYTVGSKIVKSPGVRLLAALAAGGFIVYVTMKGGA